MSIYKNPETFWHATHSLNNKSRIISCAAMINNLLASSPRTAFSTKELYNLCECHSLWQRNLIYAAIERLRSKDMVRYDPKSHKISYRPTYHPLTTEVNTKSTGDTK